MGSAAALTGWAQVHQRRLMDDALSSSGDTHEGLARRRSLLLRRRVRGWFVLVTERRIVPNAAAHRLVTPDDEPALREAAARLRATQRRGDVLTLLLSGGAVAVRAEPVPDRDSVVGIVLQLRPITRGAATSRTSPEPAGARF